MNNLSVKQQLTMAFGLLALMVLGVALLAMVSLDTANGRFTTYIDGVAYRQGLAIDIRAEANRRAIGVRDMVLVKTAKERDAIVPVVTKAHEALQERLKALKTAGSSPGVSEKAKQFIAEIEKVEIAYGPVALDILKMASADHREQAVEKMNVECRPLLQALLRTVGEYVDYDQQQAKDTRESSQASFEQQRLVLGVVAALAVLLAVLLGWVITSRMVRSLGAEPSQLSDAAEKVAQGDLSPVSGAAQAPAGSVLASMAAMQVQLVQLIGQTRGSAESIATASAEISQGNHDLSGRTEQQASALEETAASMEQLDSTVKQNADNAKQANQLAISAAAVAVKGGEVVGQVVETMKGINESSQKISDIISVIDGIAFQTNILALNAAVEAARAGEQGRGFAVVASEVRSLAVRSAGAAKEIKDLIGASVQRVATGTTLVDEAGTTMKQVVASIQRVTDLMGEISSASSEQAAGVAQVGGAVAQMDQTTQQNAALVEQMAAAASSLKTQSDDLVQAVGRFTLSEAYGAPMPVRATRRGATAPNLVAQRAPVLARV